MHAYHRCINFLKLFIMASYNNIIKNRTNKSKNVFIYYEEAEYLRMLVLLLKK